MLKVNQGLFNMTQKTFYNFNHSSEKLRNKIYKNLLDLFIANQQFNYFLITRNLYPG